MSTAVSSEPRIRDVRVTADEIIAYLTDGRVISVPLAWSWRLSDASPKQRANFRLIGAGHGVHWPDVDEDISVEGMLHGIPARPLKSPSGSRARDRKPPNTRMQSTSRTRRRSKKRVGSGVARD